VSSDHWGTLTTGSRKKISTTGALFLHLSLAVASVPAARSPLARLTCTEIDRPPQSSQLPGGSARFPLAPPQRRNQNPVQLGSGQDDSSGEFGQIVGPQALPRQKKSKSHHDANGRSSHRTPESGQTIVLGHPPFPRLGASTGGRHVVSEAKEKACALAGKPRRSDELSTAFS